MIDLILTRVKNLLGDVDLAEILKGAAAAFIIRACGAVLGLALGIVIARNLGPAGTGIYFLALSVATATTVLGMAGMGTSSIRFIAASNEARLSGQARSVANLAVSRGLIFLILLSGLIFAFSGLLSGAVFGKPEFEKPLRYISMAITPFGILQLVAEQLRGMKRISAATSLQSIFLPTITLVLFLTYGRNFLAEGAVLSFTAAAVLVMFIGLRFRRIVLPASDTRPCIETNARFLRSSKQLFFSEVSTKVIIPTVPFLLLGVWVSAGDIGIYGVANRVALLTAMILIAINSIAAPKFAALHHQGDFEALDRIARKSTSMMAIIVGPAVVVLAVFSDFVMGMFGPEFREGGVVLVILLGGQLVNVLTGPVGYLLIMAGREIDYNIVTLASACILIFLAFVLIPRFGNMGAAVAVSSVTAFQNFLLSIMVYRRLGIIMLWKSRAQRGA